MYLATGPSNSQFVCHGRSDHARSLRQMAWWHLSLAGSLTASMLALIALMIPAAGRWLLLVGCLLAVGSLVLVLLGAVIWASAARLSYARRLARLTMVIDERGMTVGGRHLPWYRVRHLVVPRHPLPGQRMLLVDDGTGPEAGLIDAEHGVRATRRRDLGIKRFTCELPLESLSCEAAHLLEAIGYYSHARFPDITAPYGQTTVHTTTRPRQPGGGGQHR